MLKDLKIHHVGVVVEKINDVANTLGKNIEFDERTIPFKDVFQKVKVLFLTIGSMKIELIEPLTLDSPIKQFLEKGGGMHHIAFETKNFDNDVKRLLDMKVKPLQKKSTVGFEDRQIFFFYMPSNN